MKEKENVQDITGKTISRRKFILGSILGACGGVMSRGVPAPKPEPARGMRCRTLGRTGLNVPVVGMGVMNAKDPSIIKKSFEYGVRLFDTAKAYGNGQNEKMTGQAIKELGARNKVILQTKVLHPVGRGLGRSPEPMTEKAIKEKVIEEVNGSLKRLQTGYIDILYYHAVDDAARLRDPGVIEALLYLKKQGKTRFLGISTHSPIIRQIVETGMFDVLMVQLNITMADDKAHLESIRHAAGKGMGIVAMKTQGGNRLAGSIMNHSAALKWVLRHDFVSTAIPGGKAVEELKQNTAVGTDLEYDKAEIQFLKDRKIKTAMGFCRLCRQCRPGCPFGTDVPSLMRVHMYAFGYGNIRQAAETLETVSPAAGIKNCLSCGSCRVSCRHAVDIQANLEQLKGILPVEV